MDESKRLRALLDERGIEHVDADDGHTRHTWWSDGDHEIGACDSGERLAVYNLTPEQAISATVGAGTLTAEQVRECVKQVYFEGYSDGATHRVHGIEETDWQTIADKLNATLGAGTCKDVCASVSEFTCSECGFNCDLMSWISLFDGDDGRHRHHHHGTPNYCPNCGRKVVDE